MGDELSVVGIGSYCLLAEKYKNQIQQAGIENNNDKNWMFIKKCSESVSDQLKIMDICQKMLYEYGYIKENVKQMREVRDTFKKGVETMQEVLEAFSIVLDE